jgi:hypothetical protein
MDKKERKRKRKRKRKSPNALHKRRVALEAFSFLSMPSTLRYTLVLRNMKTSWAVLEWYSVLSPILTMRIDPHHCM